MLQSAISDVEEKCDWLDDDPRPYITICIPMPTALAHIYSEGGLVIAADGNHHYRVSDKEVILISNHVQKIYHLSGYKREVACSFFGRVGLVNDVDERVFNFVLACRNASESIASRSVQTATEFAGLIGTHITEGLAAVKSCGKLERYPSPSPPEPGRVGRTIVSVFLDGYFQGEPSRAEIRVYHSDQKLGWELGHQHDLSRWRKTELYGSPNVAALLFRSEDSRLNKYRTDACRRITARQRNPDLPISLEDAIDAAGSFIRACSDPLARQIGGDSYERIGGHLQLATITPTRGFEWIERPENFDPL